MTSDHRTIEERTVGSFGASISAFAHRSKALAFKALFLFAFMTFAFNLDHAQQHDTQRQPKLVVEAQTSPIDPTQVRSWLEHLNDAHASDSSIQLSATARLLYDDQDPRTSSPWIPRTFFLVVLICGGLTALRMPTVWQRGLAYHHRDQAPVTFGGKVDAFVGCTFSMIVGLLAVPLLPATAVDLVIWTLRAFTAV